MTTQRGPSSLGKAMQDVCGDVSAIVVGDRINRALKAAFKATTLGAQTDKQIEKELTKARKAFVRQLRRMV